MACGSHFGPRRRLRTRPSCAGEGKAVGSTTTKKSKTIFKTIKPTWCEIFSVFLDLPWVCLYFNQNCIASTLGGTCPGRRLAGPVAIRFPPDEFGINLCWHLTRRDHVVGNQFTLSAINRLRICEYADENIWMDPRQSGILLLEKILVEFAPSRWTVRFFSQMKNAFDDWRWTHIYQKNP